MRLVHAIRIGYGHAGMIGPLRPDIIHPGRRIRRADRVVTEITTQPCDCPDDHVEVWVVKK